MNILIKLTSIVALVIAPYISENPTNHDTSQEINKKEIIEKVEVDKTSANAIQ